MQARHRESVDVTQSIAQHRYSLATNGEVPGIGVSVCQDRCQSERRSAQSHNMHPDEIQCHEGKIVNTRIRFLLFCWMVLLFCACGIALATNEPAVRSGSKVIEKNPLPIQRRRGRDSSRARCHPGQRGQSVRNHIRNPVRSKQRMQGLRHRF